MGSINPCAKCGAPCPPNPSGRGRPRKWCSDECKASAKLKRSEHKDRTCIQCGRAMMWNAYSLPQGEATCRPCRRKARAIRLASKPKQDLMDRECPICQSIFRQTRPTQKYCSVICRESRRNWAYRKPLSSTERGYGIEHQRERKRWVPIVDAGDATCCICGYWIEPGTKWHLDHTPERDGYRGVAHAACNVRDGASRAARRTPRPVLQKPCATCGSTFATVYPRQKFCSRACNPNARAA